MRAGGSKQKGADYERLICNKLSLWVSRGVSRDLFWRSAMSGGRATIGRRRGIELNRQAGDVCAIAPEGHALTSQFYVECKFYHNLGLGNFILAAGPLYEFWMQTADNARHHDRYPMLIAKQNYWPSLILVKANTLESITRPGLPLATVNWAGAICEIRKFDTLLKAEFKA